jgi:tetratricopeptide (TPR) repeat protein
MALGFGLLGRLEQKAGNNSAAKNHYQQEMTWRDRYAAAKAEDDVMRRERAAVYDKLGELHTGPDEVTVRKQSYEQARQIRVELLKADPKNLSLQYEMALSLLNLGDFYLLTLKEPGNARQSYQEAVTIREELMKGAPHDKSLPSAVAFAYYRLGTACLRMNDGSAAEQAYQRALELYEPAAQAQPPVRKAMQPYMLALARCGRHDEAAKLGLRLGKAETQSAGSLYDLAGGYALCLGALQHRHPVPPPQPDDAERYTKLCLETVRRALKAGCKDVFGLENDPDLEPIRTHPDFMAIVAELKVASATSKAK